MDRASDREPPEETPAQEEGRQGFKDEVSDAFGFLFLAHIPTIVMSATVACPVVLGLGGILTAGSNLWVLPAIAVLPLLCVLGMVAAMARRTLLEASYGNEEAPQFPGVEDVVRGAGKFFLYGLSVTSAFILPGVVFGRSRSELTARIATWPAAGGGTGGDPPV